MNKIKDYNQRFETISTFEYTECEEMRPKADVVDKNKQLLDYIYAYDSKLGYPHGDLAVFLGDDANAQVKQYIQQNLMQDNTEERAQLSLPNEVLNKFGSVITDDDIADFSRNDGESRIEYAERLRSYFERVRAENNYKRTMQKAERDIENLKRMYHIEGSK